MKRYTVLFIVVLLALTLAGHAAAGADGPPAASTYTGTLTVIVGDPMPGAEELAPIPPIFTLHLSDGRELTLLPGTAGENELLRLAGQRVSITLPAAEAEAALAADDAAAPGVAVASAALAPGAVMASPEVSGNTKWVTIACKFADVADEPRTVDFFRQMYQNTYPGLDHYWRQVSYDHINLTGSTAVGWFQLLGARSAYVPNGVYADLNKLFNDCTAAADAAVYFPDYAGINLVFNDSIGCCAWGSSGKTGSLDGVTRAYRTTWLPPWGYLSLFAVQHEMGHGYGMPHSGSTNGATYHDTWDVMGRAAFMDCHLTPGAHPVFGCISVNPIAYHREIPGWLAERVYVAGPGEHFVTLASATQPATEGYLMVRIPIDDEGLHFYTVEARQRVGYDEGLPGDAVVMHEVNRMRENPAWLIEPCPPDMGSGCSGGTEQDMLLVGETMALSTGNVAVRVDAAEGNGYRLTIANNASRHHVELSPVADAYVRKGKGDANFGTQTQLLTGANETVVSYLNFGQLPEAVISAQLKLIFSGELHPDYQKISATGRFYRGTTTPWTETGLTYNNAPDDHPDWGWPFPVAAGNLVTWDLWWTQFWTRPYQTLTVSNGMQEVPVIAYSSREGANPPRLILDYLEIPPYDPPNESHTFTPTNDATVSQAKPKLISGTKPTLQVKDAAKDFNSYVKFNVTGLTGAVQSATLRLWVTNGGPDGGRVYSTSPFYPNTTTQWLETGLKWNNAPAIGGTALDSAGAVVAGQWIELDVTAAITNNGRASFAVTNDSTNVVNYSSKEGVHAPELVVITN